ncbi:sensor histidine kinase [Desulfovibrio inopinatus]|uniref:sensor histidine kinase n=1 Tax=Desulfovibrio inopinatus TaxID=102109 RepID=UPI000427220A|nr:ATP-binding protein [Desulfovibrio inopinatus]
MNATDRIAFLEKQIESLEREKAAAMDALELASSLGSFASSFQEEASSYPLMKELCHRACSMIVFRCAAVYPIDDRTNDLGTAYYSYNDDSASLDAEVDALIRDQSFAFALQTERACFFMARNREEYILLHVLATAKRVRGMFVGVLAQDKNTILDTSIALFTVVMTAGAHALESFEINRLFREHKVLLERQVEARTVQLNESIDRLRTIFESSHAGIVVVDASNHCIVDINSAGLHMIQAAKHDVIGQVCHRFLCPTEKGNCPITDRQQRLDNSERVLLTFDKNTVPILKTVSQVKIEGRPHLVEIFVDMTEQKKSEKLKEDIQNIIRHDLKAPLNGIISVPDILLDSLDLSEEDATLLRCVQESGFRMLRMINMSLDLYKMETGVYVYSPEKMNFSSVLRTVLNELASIFRSKHVVVEVRCKDAEDCVSRPLDIYAEELLLYSLLSNLIRNAIEASPSGASVTITVDTGRSLRVAIHNEGVIPESIRTSFFDKYSTCGKIGGTGLGTYAAMLITTTMGGTIAMESSEENGVTISVDIPCTTPVESETTRVCSVRRRKCWSV